MSHPVPVLVVAGVMVFLAVMALRAWRRGRNQALLFVTAAFGVFAMKSLITAYGLWRGYPGHEDLELLGTVLDLLIAGLLVAPFLIRKRQR